MQYLLIAISTITFIVELFKSVKISQRTKYILAGLVLFVVVRKFYKSFQQAQASEKALGTENGTFAVQLHEAIFSQATRLKLSLPFVGELFNIHAGNGDESQILAISKTISDYEGVAEQYKLIYGEDLTKDLARVLNSDEIGQFNANVKAPKTNQPTVKPPVDNTATTGASKYTGKKVYAKVDGLNVRWRENSTIILFKASKNELLGTYTGKSFNLGDKWGIFHELEPTGWFPKSGGKKMLVSRDFVWFEA